MAKKASPSSEARPRTGSERPVVILASGGIDSGVLIGRALDQERPFYPLYIRQGTLWEDTEEAFLRRFLERSAALCRQRGRTPKLAPLHVLRLDLPKEYASRWARDGSVQPPDAASPSEAVYLPGRNLGLLFLGALLAQSVGADTVQIGLLAGNPFPDSHSVFLKAFQRTYELATRAIVRIEAPLRALTKAQVLQEGAGLTLPPPLRLPLEDTFSCIRPEEGMHCGRCNKCAERRHGFTQAGLPDPTVYAEDGEKWEIGERWEK